MQTTRWLELFFIFILLPIFYITAVNDQQTWLMPALGVVGLFCLCTLLSDKKFNRLKLWNATDIGKHLSATLTLFIPCTILLTLVFYWVAPNAVFSLVKHDQVLLLTTLLIYPIVSVIPQEIIFRTYFFHRFKPIIPSKWQRLFVSTLLFSFAHIVYANWVAVMLSAIGGGIFGYRYIMSKSTCVVVIEHTLWGSYVFVVGLGTYLLVQ